MYGFVKMDRSLTDIVPARRFSKWTDILSWQTDDAYAYGLDGIFQSFLSPVEGWCLCPCSTWLTSEMPHSSCFCARPWWKGATDHGTSKRRLSL